MCIFENPVRDNQSIYNRYFLKKPFTEEDIQVVYTPVK